MKINCHSDFQPLKEIIVGRSYHQDSFNFIDEPRIRDPLKRILEETEEDLLNLCAVLEEHDVKVYRPDSPPVELVQEYIDNSAKPPIPSLAVRDGYITVANTLYRFVYKDEMNSIFNLLIDGRTFDPYRRKDDFDSLEPLSKEEFRELTQVVAGLRGTRYTAYNKAQGKFVPGMNIEHALNIRTHMIDGPCIVRLGKRLIVDSFPNYQIKWVDEEFSDYEFKYTFIHGHSDGTFCPIKPGLYAHTVDFAEYQETVPGWEGIYLEGQGWESDTVNNFLNIKYKNDGKWWVQGEENNDALIHFVGSWLDEWVGYIEETVFDVNMLSINENLILCTNEPPEHLKDAFKRHKVEYIITPFRHRFFWDGGLHCITLDVNREGNCEDYFR